ncbi:Gfo/Idh/MocA family protein [Lapidilactobacillus luobeiensis]|uniref:Gfo/Idh/MocA family protein n=1 Tax=Lapidilactobacillus luobeiensis TaxID=2950371 RepID=UPI0021C423BA|nr:Gfo/Idh/MocA family oxidoreductase [Lapidilactobacillus luobeiensis]
MVNFGIIGCGSIANVHATVINNIPDAHLVACCDIDAVKGREFARRFECQFYLDADSLIKRSDIDVITIATPHYLHGQMAIAALRAGKHVICEKPMALSVEEAKQVLAVSRQVNRIYVVCYQNRFNPTMVKLKEILQTNKFGKLQGVKGIVTWHRDLDYYQRAPWKGYWRTEGGGVLINQAIHTLDAICWLVGRPVSVKGKIMTSILDGVIEVEDSAMATCQLADKTPVLIFASNDYSSDPTPLITLDYEKATIELGSDTLKINGEELVVDSSTDVIGKAYWGNGHQRLFQTVVAKIKHRPDILVDCLASENAIDSLMLVKGIYRSSKTDSWQTIEG